MPESAVSIDTSQSRIPEPKVKLIAKKLSREIKTLTEAASAGYKDNYSCLNAADDAAMLQRSLDMAKQFKDADLMIVIGIGGSNLGTQAVQEALLGKLHSYSGKPAVLYADTVDAAATKQALAIMEKVAKQKGKVLLNIISKSGATTETIANAEIFIKSLQEYEKEWQKSIVITTDEGSGLWKLAEKQKIQTLPIPQVIGGRYSVFSSIGTFPLAVLGVDVKAFLSGASEMRHSCIEAPEKNIAARLAAIQYLHAKTRRNISDLFVFGTDFEATGKWRRQLYAESLGKNKSRSGKKTVSGITPTVSVGSTDLHSMAQLYLAGPQDKYTVFLELTTAPGLRVPKITDFDKLVPSVQGKEFKEIMDAIAKGTQTAFSKAKRPFTTISMERTAHSLGEYMMLEMMSVIYLSSLLDVNSFDQPSVELYKEETRKLLR